MTTISCSFSSKLSSCVILIIVNICIIGHVAMAQQKEGNTTNRRLRIAVPVKEGFKEFVNVKYDPTTREPTIKGFSIDIFKAVVNSAMPKPFEYDLVPFAKADGTMNGSYDDMLKAVYSGEYDAAVGDISIRYYRTENWVDFTMPYSESGVSTLIPLDQKNNSNSSLSKLAKDLIAAAAGVCFLCLVAALLPRFIDSGGKEPKRTRLVIVVCFLIGVVLSTCFTLIVISLVTTQSPTHTVTKNNVDDYLMRKGRNVGHQTGSFVRKELIERGFKESQLKPFSTIDELLKMLNKGTEQGGIDAAIEETSQLKLFLTYHCTGYTLVDSAQLYGDGLGFAFQKGSKLVQNVSVAILKVTNSYEQLRNITKRSIGNLDECLADTTFHYNILANWKPTKWILIAGGISVVFLVIILILGCLKNFK